MLSISGKPIVSRYVVESITTDAGHFGCVGLCQLRTKQWTTWPKRPASVVIDSATYLLTISKFLVIMTKLMLQRLIVVLI